MKKFKGLCNLISKQRLNLKSANILERFQFQSLGYFCVDKDTTKFHLVFNRTVALRDSWTNMSE